MKRVVVLNGVARSGKDSFADFLKEYGKAVGCNSYTISTVYKVKELSKAFGVGDEKTNKERRFWSDLKDAWSLYNDGPFNDVITKIAYLYDGKYERTMYFIMCREPDEIAKFKQHFGDECVTVLIRRSGLDMPDNHADQNVENYEYDYFIDNEKTLDELRQSAATFFECIW